MERAERRGGGKKRRVEKRLVVAPSASAPEVPDEEEGADTENQDNAGAIWTTRCNPGAWKPLIQGLSETMVESINQSQFGTRNMLKMPLTSLAYRQLCAALMRTAVYHKEENLIEL
jgi:hypothetical protein